MKNTPEAMGFSTTDVAHFSKMLGGRPPFFLLVIFENKATKVSRGENKNPERVENSKKSGPPRAFVFELEHNVTFYRTGSSRIVNVFIL